MIFRIRLVEASMEAAVVLGFMGSDGNYITAHPNKDPLYYQGQHISRLEDQTLE